MAPLSRSYYYSSGQEAKNTTMIKQPAWNGQREQTWCSSSLSVLRQDRRDPHTVSVQMNIWWIFPVETVRGGHYTKLQSLKRERSWFPKAFATGLEPKVAYTTWPSSVICHFIPSLEETYLSKPLFLAAGFTRKSEPAFSSIMTTCWFSPAS